MEKERKRERERGALNEGIHCLFKAFDTDRLKNGPYSQIDSSHLRIVWASRATDAGTAAPDVIERGKVVCLFVYVICG